MSTCDETMTMLATMLAEDLRTTTYWNDIATNGDIVTQVEKLIGQYDAASKDAANYSQRLAEIDAVLLRYSVLAISPDESIAATLERTLVEYAKERQRRKAAEDDAAAWQAYCQDAILLMDDICDAAAVEFRREHERADGLRTMLAEAQDKLTSMTAEPDANAAQLDGMRLELLKIEEALEAANVNTGNPDTSLADDVRALIAEHNAALAALERLQEKFAGMNDQIVAVRADRDARWPNVTNCAGNWAAPWPMQQCGRPVSRAWKAPCVTQSVSQSVRTDKHKNALQSASADCKAMHP